MFYESTHRKGFQSLIGILQTRRDKMSNYKQILFQSLIGILQTRSKLPAPASNILFQSLIGILQTFNIAFSYFMLQGSFNPSQVFYKQYSSTASKASLKLFQSLIGILQTQAYKRQVFYACQVSIPHRYSTNFILILLTH